MDKLIWTGGLLIVIISILLGIKILTNQTFFPKEAEVKIGQIWLYETDSSDNPFTEEISVSIIQRIIDVKGPYVLYLQDEIIIKKPYILSIKNEKDTFTRSNTYFLLGNKLLKE